jgi:hypothetical protein
LLGLYTTNKSTVNAELRVANQYLDYLEVLWSDPVRVGSDKECAWPADPNMRPCTDTALAWMINSSVWSEQNRTQQKLHFFVSYSNDFDGSAISRGMFAGAEGGALWGSFCQTWIRAMAHPRYFKVSDRPVFKILGPYNLLAVQCAGNRSLVQSLVHDFRVAAIAAGRQVVTNRC